MEIKLESGANATFYDIHDNETVNIGKIEGSYTPEIGYKDTNNDNNELSEKIAGSFFGIKEKAMEFLTAIRTMSDLQITNLVKILIKKGDISEQSSKKDLWQPLFNAGLYHRTYQNWHDQII